LSLVRLLVERPVHRGRWLAGAVLAVAAFNLAFRIGNEMVQVWDESLFAITAAEMVSSGDPIGTTFLGALDYYNSKPPLHVWLVALSFKVLGPGVVSLRVPAMVAAWLTVAVLIWWAGRAFGRAMGVMAGLVLATSYGFLYVHSGRSGNSDSLFTLLVLLTVVTSWAARDRPWRRAWLGVLVGLVFMVKGMGILMPAVIVAGVELGSRWRGRERWLPLATAAAIAVLIAMPWAVARWQVDGWRFFDAMFVHDFVERASTVLEGHEGAPYYYLYFLQKHHYDWLLAGVVALACLPDRWSLVRMPAAGPGRFTRVLLLSWFAATFVLPSVVVTKLGWYLNSFYPLFALGVGWAIVESWRAAEAHPRRRALVAATVVVALGVAEGKLAWHSYRLLDLERSAQSLFLAHGPRLANQAVYATAWPHADRFVVRTVGGHCMIAPGVEAFLAASHPDDLWLGPPAMDARLVPLATTGRQTLYRRLDGTRRSGE
jgi:4-amino-4-deoxy-L-arabinose transferase-like glycosyltransferase